VRLKGVLAGVGMRGLAALPCWKTDRQDEQLELPSHAFLGGPMGIKLLHAGSCSAVPQEQEVEGLWLAGWQHPERQDLFLKQLSDSQKTASLLEALQGFWCARPFYAVGHSLGGRRWCRT
jgi:hypothetical protein